MAENELSSYNLLQCKEVPTFICWDVFKTLFVHTNENCYPYSLQHNIFRYPRSHAESAYFEEKTYDSFKIGEKTGKEMWQYWNDDINLSSVCNTLYDKMDAHYAFFDRSIEFEQPIWVTSGAIPALSMKCYIEGLFDSRLNARPYGRNKRIFGGNIYADIVWLEDKENPTRGEWVFCTNDVLSRLPEEITYLTLWPFYENGRFNMLNDGNNVLIQGSSTTREKSNNNAVPNSEEEYFSDLSGEISSPLFGLSISDPTQPPIKKYKDPTVTYNDNFDRWIAIDNESLMTVQTEPYSLDLWRTIPIRDHMINSLRSLTMQKNAIKVHKTDAHAAFESEFVDKLKGTALGDVNSIMWLRYYLCDMYAPAGPSGGNIISAEAIGRLSGTFDRGMWGIDFAYEKGILNGLLERNSGKKIRCVRNERLILSNDFYPYVMNGASRNSKDFYQHHFSTVRLSGPRIYDNWCII